MNCIFAASVGPSRSSQTRAARTSCCSRRPTGGGVAWWTMSSRARHEAQDRDVAPDQRCFGAVVAVPAVELLDERVQARVLAAIGDFRGDERLATEFALGVRDEVAVPLRVRVYADSVISAADKVASASLLRPTMTKLRRRG